VDEPDLMMRAFSACEAKAKRVGWEHLSSTERILVLAVDFYFHVEAHGIGGFYSNPEGNRAVESVWALQQLGASEAAAILQSCNAAFPSGSPPTDQSDRHQLKFELNSAGAFPVDVYDESAPEWKDVYQRLEEFVECNRQFFLSISGTDV
jgi:hypothetical protein